MQISLWKKGLALGIILLLVGASSIPSISNEIVTQSENQQYDHDVEIKSIDSPKDGPGKTYPVQATIKNVGQYAECCFSIDIKIGEPVILDTLFTEYDWPGSGTYYPGEYSGWTDEHKNISYYYGWIRSTTSYSGGTPYEACLPSSYALADYCFYSYAIDTSAYDILNLRFKSYINHSSGQGLYSMEAGYSTDAETWYTAWHEEPDSSGQYEVDVPILGGSNETYIGFWIKGDPSYFNSWYIDNIKLVAIGVVEEYLDYAYYGSYIESGEEVTFEFEDWTPDFLAYEETGSIDYIAVSYIEMDGDQNPGNDIKTKQFTLDYWHDIGVEDITSPETYISPGTHEIEAIVANYGTFPEWDMFCTAEIREYITDPINGTLVYEDYITDIDLEMPLYGTEYLMFTDYNFMDEGKYELTICILDDNDDFLDNNCLTKTIYVQESPPDPILKGPKEGATTIPYSFYIRAPDKEGNKVYYRFDWDDGEGWTPWDGEYNHQTWIEYIYTWKTHGYKTIKYQARDDTSESDIEYLRINISDYDDITQGKYVDVYMEYDPAILRVWGLVEPDDDDLYSGNTVKYSIVVWNNGTKDANNVQVHFQLLNLQIPSTSVDVPAKGNKLATTTWTIPKLNYNEELIINKSCLHIRVEHPEDADITPYNEVVNCFNYELIDPPFDAIHPVFVYNRNPTPLEVFIDVELVVTDKEWEISVDRDHFIIAPESVEWVNLIVEPPVNIKLGDKCEAVVSAYKVAKNTKDEEDPLRSEAVRTTYDENAPTIQIIKPGKGLYLFNFKILPFIIIPLPRPLIIGKIMIEIKTSDIEGDIENVYFYIDDEAIYTSYHVFSCSWEERFILETHTIKVKVEDTSGQEGNDQIDVIKII